MTEEPIQVAKETSIPFLSPLMAGSGSSGSPSASSASSPSSSSASSPSASSASSASSTSSASSASSPSSSSASSPSSSSASSASSPSSSSASSGSSPSSSSASSHSSPSSSSSSSSSPCTVDLDIEGLDENEEDNPGGFVRKDGVRKKIILKSTATEGNVILTRIPDNNTKVKVFTAKNGGTEITFNGIDNKFAVAVLPKNLYVQGNQISTQERDVTLTLTHDSDPSCSDSVKFSVFGVEVKAYEAGTASEKTTFKRDEIFDVKIDTHDVNYTGTMNITLSYGTKNENLGTRGSVQMYDFGYDVDDDGDIDPGQTSISFTQSDQGKRTFQAVINTAQKIMIMVKDTTNSAIWGVTEPITITHRMRQYAEVWTGGSNGNLNAKDSLITSNVDYWSDWHLGDPPYSLGYTMPEEAVKAVMFKESSMIETNLMQLTQTAINGMTAGNPDRDWNWNATPDAQGCYDLETAAPYMIYTGVDGSTEQNSTRWGIRWLYRCRRTYKYNVAPCEGMCSDPGFRTWIDTFKRYNTVYDDYGIAVYNLWNYGQNIEAETGQPGTPETLWPILTNGKPRDE